MSMTKMLAKLWSDDCGALIATEFLFVATILVIGIIVGLSNIRDAVTTELTELANAILALSQGYTISGLSGCCAEVQGSQTLDIPGLVPEPICVPNFILSDINSTPCN
jgi:Flp pilus assembly pilin Flp